MSTYSFLEFQCAIVGPGGVINLGDGSGAAEEGVTFEPSDNINTMEVGADGSGQHSLSANKSGRITVRLLKTSPINALLSAMYAFQTASGANHGRNTISGVDRVRGDVITCQQVAFARAPNLNYSKNAGMNEWVFDAVSIERTLGAGV